MTDAKFSTEIEEIRSAITRAHDHLLTNNPINVTPLRDLIDGLIQSVEKQAPRMNRDLRDRLATDLGALVSELEALERLVETRLVGGGD